MKTKYIIDGSNLMQYLGYVKNQNPQSVISARERLNKELSRLFTENKNVEVVIVYDVHSLVPFEKMRVGKIEVVYAEGPKETQPADAQIIRIAKKRYETNIEVIVVTNDNKLKENLLFNGVRSIKCIDFMTKFSLKQIT